MLNVNNLSVLVQKNQKLIPIVQDVSFTLERDSYLGIVGESGSGKTMLISACLGMTPPFVKLKGEVMYNGKNLIEANSQELNQIRGKKISFLGQDMLNSLNPYLSIGFQMNEVLHVHKNLNKDQANHKSLACLRLLKIRDPEKVINQYPHELSGGMRQRVVIAMSLLCEPDILVADEPTTALDTITQSRIMGLFQNLRKESRTSIIFVTHDLNLVRHICDEVLVLYAGRIMESGKTETIFKKSSHPYTCDLLRTQASLEKMDSDLFTIPGSPLHVSDFSKFGCPFYPRCSSRLPQCQNEKPVLKEQGKFVRRACHLSVEHLDKIYHEKSYTVN